MDYEILMCLSVGASLIGISTIIQAFMIRSLTKRVNLIEKICHLRLWLDAIEKGESPSDMAYMKEKGYLK